MANDATLPLPELTSSVGPVQASGEGYELHPDQENLFLALYRLVPREVTTGDDNRKQPYLEAVVKRWNKVSKQWRDDPTACPVTAYARRLEAQLAGWAEAGTTTRSLDLETEGRLVAGLGYDSPLEVGLTLHPVYGFPYLPGSSVKGVARAYAEDVADAEEMDLQAVFGSPSKNEHDGTMQRGVVTFMDAVPTEVPDLEVDVMTPHVGDYDQDEQNATPPGDWHEPRPVPFLAVAAGTSFCFPLASRDDAALEQAAAWLRQGLFWLGAGGKTAAGYGLFTNRERRREGAKRRQKREEERQRQQLRDNLPPKKRRIGKNSSGILAEVVGPHPSPDPAWKTEVQLHVEGYEDQTVPMTGQYGSREPGEWVEVYVVHFIDDDLPLVKYTGPFRP